MQMKGVTTHSLSLWNCWCDYTHVQYVQRSHMFFRWSWTLASLHTCHLLVQSKVFTPAACFVCPDKRGQLDEVEMRSAIDDLRLRFQSKVPKKPLGSDIFPNTYPTSQTPSRRQVVHFSQWVGPRHQSTHPSTSQKLRINESDLNHLYPNQPFLGSFPP